MKTNYRHQLIQAQRAGASWPTTARLAFLEAWQNWHTARRMLALVNRHGGNKATAMKAINKYAAIMRQRKQTLDKLAASVA